MANKSGFLTKLIYGGIFDEYKAKSDMEGYFQSFQRSISKSFKRSDGLQTV